MADRPKMFDDLAGLAGGAFSPSPGCARKAEALVRARVDETLRKLDLVRREELDAVAELAATPAPGRRRRRRGSPPWPAAGGARVAGAGLAPAQPAGGGGPGMIA